MNDELKGGPPVLYFIVHRSYFIVPGSSLAVPPFFW